MENREEVYSTKEGVVSLDSPTKNKILDLLRESNKTGTEIRDEINKSKSTISVHLSDLKQKGLIKEKKHPSDDRKKIYSLSSKLVGKAKAPRDKHYKEILQNIQKTSGDEYNFLKNLFHVIRYGLSSFGLDIHPALKEMGRDVGKSIAPTLNAKNFEELLSEIKDFWKENGLGNATIEENKYLVVRDCFDCSEMPNVNTTLCSLDEGIIEGIISQKLDLEVEVKEKECFGLGDNHCKFEISEVPSS
ncbi:transcriptional regulator [archaeon SCG-AAA382B04]|nr:transcriptional regulator [archaeon SCG-AAA382B04]